MSRPSILARIVFIAMMVATLAAPMAEAAGRKDAGRGAMALSAQQRADARKAIIAADRHRPVRPGVLPGYRPPSAVRPLPGRPAIRDEIRREIRREVRRRYIGRVVAGVVLGAIIQVSVSGRPPARPPSADLCWVWSDRSRTRGYWYYCHGD